MSKNNEILANTSSTMFIDNIPITYKLKENNHILSDLIKEIKRSANVGIGYAFSVEELMDENCFIDD